MKTLASYNIKGGVGKTTTAVNLAYLAAEDGGRTLVWDLDPQGAATFLFRIRPKVKGGGKALIRRRRPIDDAIKGTDYENLDLLPADFSFRNMDLILDHTRKPTQRLAKLLKPVAEEYDYVFLDCPPSISLLSESIFYAADALIIPMIPSTFSLRTYDQTVSFIRRNGVRNLEVLPFFSMVDRRKVLHRYVSDTLPSKRSGVLKTSIPYASDVECMGVYRAAVGSFAPDRPSALAYEALWKEIKQRLSSNGISVDRDSATGVRDHNVEDGEDRSAEQRTEACAQSRTELIKSTSL